MSVLDANGPGVDPQNPPRRIAQLENIPRHALDGEIFIDGAQERLARFKHNAIIGVVRDRAAGSQREQSRPLAPAHAMVHRIVMDERGAPAASSAESFGEHFQNVVEFLSGQIAVGIRGPDQVEEVLFRTIFAGRAGDHLLGEDVERFIRNLQAIQFAFADAAERGHTFDKLIAAERKQAAFGQPAAFVFRTPDALKERCDGSGRSQLTNQIYRADVDAQFQRGRGDQRFELPAFQTVLRVKPQPGRETAVMRGDLVLAESLGQMVRDAFGQASRVDKHQRRPVRLDQIRQTVIYLRPDLVRHHGFQRRTR